MLACPREGETFAELAAGSGAGAATARRSVNETVALLAARAPQLRQAARDATRNGHACGVVDGTLIPVDRVAADRPSCSGKHTRHGMNLPVIASPAGTIRWVSGPLPGAVHDNKAGWIGGVLAGLGAAGLIVLAGKGYHGAAHAKIPYRRRTSRTPGKTPTAPTRNSAHPATARTPSSRRAEFSASSAAAPGAPASPPNPSTQCKSATQTQDEKGSLNAAGAGCLRLVPEAVLRPHLRPRLHREAEPGMPARAVAAAGIHERPGVSVLHIVRMASRMSGLDAEMDQFSGAVLARPAAAQAAATGRAPMRHGPKSQVPLGPERYQRPGYGLSAHV